MRVGGAGYETRLCTRIIISPLYSFNAGTKITMHNHLSIIGASLSEPHTNQYYEKIAVLMYVTSRYVKHVLASS